MLPRAPEWFELQRPHLATPNRFNTTMFKGDNSVSSHTSLHSRITKAFSDIGRPQRALLRCAVLSTYARKARMPARRGPTHRRTPPGQLLPDSTPTAYIRHCIAAKSALESGNDSLAADQAAAACRLERHLDPHDLHLPRLRSTEATIQEQQGAGEEAVCRTLIDGAHEWVRRLTAVGQGHEDFRAIADDLHNHFRRLSGSALRLDRRAEALAAFEIGRALAWAADASPDMLGRTLGGNPFIADGSGVDTVVPPDLQADPRPGRRAPHPHWHLAHGEGRLYPRGAWRDLGCRCQRHARRPPRLARRIHAGPDAGRATRPQSPGAILAARLKARRSISDPYFRKPEPHPDDAIRPCPRAGRRPLCPRGLWQQPAPSAPSNTTLTPR
jgi:hypothetical protein